MARKGPKAPPRKKNLVVIRGFEGWGEWLRGLAAHQRSEVVPLIDKCLTDLARQVGYPDPPKRY